MSGDVTLLVVPQVNVNDETVLLVRWVAQDGQAVSSGDLVCEVETTKAVAEINSPATGVLVHSAQAGDRVAVGATIGAIGASADIARAVMSRPPTPSRVDEGSTAATPKAIALAKEHGISLDAVRKSGVTGTIKESDVRAFAGAKRPPVSAGFLFEKYADAEGPVPAFDAAVAANLRFATSSLILTSLDMDCAVDLANAEIAKANAAGRILSLAHIVLSAVARSLPAFSRLTSVVHDGTLYRYRSVDVGLVVRSRDGRLFTPVIRGADRLTVDGVATACQAAAMRVLRGQAKAADLEGAAFTVSQVPVAGTTRVVALPSAGQSAILGVSAERTVPSFAGERVVAKRMVTLTLSYDHALCDGVYAAEFLAAVVKFIEAP